MTDDEVNDIMDSQDSQQEFSDDDFSLEEKEFMSQYTDIVGGGEFEWEPAKGDDTCFCARKSEGEYWVIRYNFRTGEEIYDKKFNTFDSMVRFYKLDTKNI